MRKLSTILVAVALMLGLAQCKKEQTTTPQSEGVMITLNVGDNNNGSRANVNPNAAEGVDQVTFEDGDQILVASGGHYVGTLTRTAGVFSGSITDPVEDEKLYFYFLGNKIDVSTLTAGTTTECMVNISDQNNYPHLPVISMGESTEDYVSGTTSYSSRLYNKCSLMKFNVTTPSTTAIRITGMNNKVTVNFDPTTANTDEGFTYGQVDGGLITMSAKDASNVTWAIVLPQAALPAGDEGSVYTFDGYKGTRPAITEPITSNQYLSEGIALTANTEDMKYAVLTFEAKTAGATVKLRKGISGPSVTLEYSTNGITWTSYSVTTSGVAITLNNIGDKVMFRGTNTKFAKNSTDKNYNYFSLGGDCYVYGNVMSLINSTDFATTTAFADESSYNFCYLFKNCSRLYNHPTKSIVLPATTLATGCYCRMFNGCTNLTAIPDLPATKLADNCYGFMFYGCTNLTAVPDLPATILANSCYLHMFENCSGLTTVPTTLPVTTLAYSCYQGMFKNCTSLTTAPELPAPTLAENCYQDMFWGCSALTSVTCLATDISASGCVDYWFSSVTTTGTFYKASTMSGWTVGTNVPANWTIVDAN